MSDEITMKTLQGGEGIQEDIELVDGVDADPFNPVLGDFKEQVDKIVEEYNVLKNLEESDIKDYLLVIFSEIYKIHSQRGADSKNYLGKKLKEIQYLNTEFNKIKNSVLKEIIITNLKNKKLNKPDIIGELYNEIVAAIKMGDSDIEDEKIRKLRKGELSIYELSGLNFVGY